MSLFLVFIQWMRATLVQEQPMVQGLSWMETQTMTARVMRMKLTDVQTQMPATTAQLPQKMTVLASTQMLAVIVEAQALTLTMMERATLKKSLVA